MSANKNSRRNTKNKYKQVKFLSNEDKILNK